MFHRGLLVSRQAVAPAMAVFVQLPSVDASMIDLLSRFVFSELRVLVFDPKFFAASFECVLSFWPLSSCDAARTKESLSFSLTYMGQIAPAPAQLEVCKKE